MFIRYHVRRIQEGYIALKWDELPFRIINCLIVQREVFALTIFTNLLQSFGLLAPKTIIKYLAEGYSRYLSCTLN